VQYIINIYSAKKVKNHFGKINPSRPKNRSTTDVEVGNQRSKFNLRNTWSFCTDCICQHLL